MPTSSSRAGTTIETFGSPESPWARPTRDRAPHRRDVDGEADQIDDRQPGGADEDGVEER